MASGPTRTSTVPRAWCCSTSTGCSRCATPTSATRCRASATPSAATTAAVWGSCSATRSDARRGSCMLKGMLAGCCGALLTVAPAALAHDGGYQPGTVDPSLETGVAFGGDRLAGEHAIVGGENSLYAGNSA